MSMIGSSVVSRWCWASRMRCPVSHCSGDVPTSWSNRRPGAGALLGVAPVRGAAPAVEQAGLAEQVGAGADAQHAGAALDRGLQRGEQLRWLPHGGVTGRNTDEVGRRESLQAVRGLHLEAV